MRPPVVAYGKKPLHDRAHFLPLLDPDPGHSGKPDIIIRKGTIRRPPRRHEQQQIDAVFLCRKVRGVGKVGIRPKRHCWKLRHYFKFPTFPVRLVNGSVPIR